MVEIQAQLSDVCRCLDPEAQGAGHVRGVIGFLMTHSIGVDAIAR